MCHIIRTRHVTKSGILISIEETGPIQCSFSLYHKHETAKIVGGYLDGRYDPLRINIKIYRLFYFRPGSSHSITVWYLLFITEPLTTAVFTTAYYEQWLPKCIFWQRVLLTPCVSLSFTIGTITWKPYWNIFCQLQCSGFSVLVNYLLFC